MLKILSSRIFSAMAQHNTRPTPPIKDFQHKPLPLRRKTTCALTIAGSDSGGGAGIQADLKTFAALGVHGTSAITCVTAQNPKIVRSIQGISAELVGAQIEAVFTGFSPKSVKTGMLYSRPIIEAVLG